MVKKRYFFVDFLRFWAIYLMFWDHGLKLFYNFNQKAFLGKLFTDLADKTLGLTSLCSSLFLFLVGFCLVISYNLRGVGSHGSWLFSKFKRGTWFILLSYFLFFFKFGREHMESILTSGILQLIGLTTILGSWLFLIPRKSRMIMTGALNFLLLIVNYALYQKGAVIPLLNAYIFPFLPHTSYVLSGLLVGEIWWAWKQKGGQSLRNLLLGSTFGLAVFLSVASFNPYFIFRSRYLTGSFWHPSIDLVVFNTLLITTAVAVLAKFEEGVEKIYLVRKLSLFGQDALTLYVFHVLLGWGVSKYLLNERVFGIWASFLAVATFLWLGWQWIKFRMTKANYSSL